MSTVKSTSFLGIFDDGFEATDEKGHTGAATTKDDAKLALEASQELDTSRTEIAGMTRLRSHTPKEEDASEKEEDASDDAEPKDADEGSEKASDADEPDEKGESDSDAESDSDSDSTEKSESDEKDD